MTDTEDMPVWSDDPEAQRAPRRLWLWTAGAALLVLVVGFLAGAMISPSKQGKIDSLESRLASARKQHAADETKLADQEDQRRALLARVTAKRPPQTAASRKAAWAAAMAKRKGITPTTPATPTTPKTPATPLTPAARKAAIIAAMKAKAAAKSGAKSGALSPSKPAHRAKGKHRSRRHHKKSRKRAATRSATAR